MLDDADCSPIGLGHDFRHCGDLPERALAERANREEADWELTSLADHLAVALDGETETMRIGTGEPSREQAPDQRLIEVWPEA